MLKGLKNSANNTILAFLSISCYEPLVCLRMLNHMVTSKTPCKTVNLCRKRFSSRISDITAHTQERITNVHRCVIHAEQKEKERCHIRGTLYSAGTKFKGQMVCAKDNKQKSIFVDMQHQIQRVKYKKN